jgi:transposase-like protein
MDFTPEEKVDIVFEGMNNDITITELCEKYDISRKTYYDWKNEIKSSAINKWENTKVGRSQSQG